MQQASSPSPAALAGLDRACTNSWCRSDADEPLELGESLVVGELARRVLAECRSGGVHGSGEAAVERQARTTDEIDHHSSAVGRILDRQAKLQVHRHAAEQLAFHPEEADLVVVLPGNIVAWADVDVVRIEPMF